MTSPQDAPAGPVLGPEAGAHREMFEASVRAALAPLVGDGWIDDAMDAVMGGPHFAALLSSAREEGRKDCARDLRDQITRAIEHGASVVVACELLADRWSP